jgi:hypothetical protein
MTKCKDGRKHIIVEEYTRKDGTKVRSHERSCPARGSQSSDIWYLCCVCREQFGLDDLQDVDIKGETKKVCDECVDTVHGLI